MQFVVGCKRRAPSQNFVEIHGSDPANRQIATPTNIDDRATCFSEVGLASKSGEPRTSRAWAAVSVSGIDQHHSDWTSDTRRWARR